MAAFSAFAFAAAFAASAGVSRFALGTAAYDERTSSTIGSGSPTSTAEAPLDSGGALPATGASTTPPPLRPSGLHCSSTRLGGALFSV